MWFFKKKKASAPVIMLESEKWAIRSFAEGREDLRDLAIAIHRRYIPTIGVRGDIFQKFMAEVDHPHPDVMLRSEYRARVIATQFGRD